MRVGEAHNENFLKFFSYGFVSFCFAGQRKFQLGKQEIPKRLPKLSVNDFNMIVQTVIALNNL